MAVLLIKYEGINVLYGCLPAIKQNLRFVKKSAANLYPALFVDSPSYLDLAHWPRCISAGKLLISYNGLFMSEHLFRFSSPRSDPFHISSLLAASSPSKAYHIPFFS